MEQRFKTIRKRSGNSSCVEILTGLYQVIPEQITLSGFTYNQGKELVLAGQTQELNSVFGLVSQLEGSVVFKKFNIKIRYATQRKLRDAEIVDFEIICLKK